MEPTSIDTHAITRTAADRERENLILGNIEKASEIAGLQEKIRRLEYMERYHEKRSALLTKVQVIVMTTPVGEASKEEQVESFEEINNLLLDLR